jgi:aminoglycoside phosphotransferase (APT) family kinase protein
MNHDEADSRQEAGQLLRGAGLPAEGLVAGRGVANAVWLTTEHVVRLSSGRFRDAFAHEAGVLRRLPPDIPRPMGIANGRRDGAGEFLILGRLPGTSLAEAWPSLTTASRRRIVHELAGITRRLHALEPAPWMDNPWVTDALAGTWADAYHPPPSLSPELVASARQSRPDAADVLDRISAFIAARMDAFEGDRDVPVHSDLHFGNVVVDGGRISGLVDFEGFRLAPADTELDMLLRSIRWALASPEIGSVDHALVPRWFQKVYPGLFAHPRLIERLEVYEALWHLVQLHHWKPGATWMCDPAATLEALIHGRFREGVSRLLR